MDTIRTKRHKRLIEILIDERKRAGLRQIDVARRIKRTQAWVARLEGGDRRLDVIEFLSVAEALGFDPANIVRDLSRI